MISSGTCFSDVDKPASTCSISNVVPQHSAGQLVTILLSSKDVNGNPRTSGGDAIIAVVQKVPSGVPILATIQSTVDNHDGTYSITYRATVAGNYSIGVTVNGLVQCFASSQVRVVAGKWID